MSVSVIHIRFGCLFCLFACSTKDERKYQDQEFKKGVVSTRRENANYWLRFSESKLHGKTCCQNKIFHA